MIRSSVRFLLSLLALLTGLVVPGLASAQACTGAETEIGESVGGAVDAAVFLVRARENRLLRADRPAPSVPGLRVVAQFATPAGNVAPAPTVHIGSDRARR